MIWVDIDGTPSLLRLHAEGQRDWRATLEPDTSAAARREGREPKPPTHFVFTGQHGGNGRYIVETGGQRTTCHIAAHRGGLRVWTNGLHADVTLPDPLSGISGHPSSEGSLTAPMPGVITGLVAKPGRDVEAGAPLLIMEAMKMEHTIKAPSDGTLKGFRFAAGDQVKEGDQLVDFEPAE